MSSGSPARRARPAAVERAPSAGERTWEGEADAVARREAATSGDLRATLGRKLGFDFSTVRFRTDDRTLPAGVGAETSGDTVRIAPGHFRPELPLGRALLAHELAHVAQQGAVPARGDGFGRPGKSIADPGGPGLSPAPLGMRQRTVGCSTPQRRNPSRPAPAHPAPTPATSTPATAATSTSATAPASTPATGVAPAADWDFTRADYAALVRSGGALTFDADSAWFPQAYRDNLIATIAAVLDSSRTPISSEGVNTRDFYHGHVGVPNGTPLPSEVTTARDAVDAASSGLPRPRTAENLPEYRRSDQVALPLAGTLLERTARLPGVVVVYHTFEASGPSMQPGDPRRNWMTPLATNQPATFTPPYMDNASSWSNNFSSVLQFTFLIDTQGRIHVRIGAMESLSTVTGQVEVFGR